MELGTNTNASEQRRAKKLAYMAGWRQRNPNAKKEWHKLNREHVARYYRAYREANKEITIKRMADWRQNNFVRRKEYRKAWKIKNPKKHREIMIRCEEKRRKKYLHVSLKRSMSVLLQHHLKRIGSSKFNRRTQEIIGCDSQFIKKWIASQFLPGMSFSNRSEWHVDHIFPAACCGKEERLLLLAWHYRNLRPMWNVENNKKWCRLTEESIVSAYLLGIDRIYLFTPKQAEESLLKKAESLGISVVRGWL